MKINQLYTPNPRFLRSTQLERDFSNPAALEGLILTPGIEAHLTRLGRGLDPSSGQRAWRITGDYGSGKSSFALLLANLISRQNNELPKHLRQIQRKLLSSGGRQRLLPILVTGSREPISMVLLRALGSVLENQIDGRLNLNSRNTVRHLLKSPETLSDDKVIQVVGEAARELHERELYRGIFIVLDELGKFLEFAALNPERQDVFFLQQLGESCARSGDSCLFTVGLLHQGFSAYADKLSEAGQREWEKVAGRFEELVFSQPLNEAATLVAAALELQDSHVLWGWKTKAQTDMGRAIEIGIFGAGAPKSSLTQLAPSLYPLHCAVLPVLVKFFRRFGQNERSLFSFLFSSEPFALQWYSERDASPEQNFRLADFYDFAAHNFAHRLSTQSFRSHWNHIDGVIRSYPSDRVSDLRILKTIGILNTIESPELHPTLELLSLALDDIPDLAQSLKNLVTRGVLHIRGRSGGYALWPHGSVNLEQAFIRATEVISGVPNIVEAIRDHLETRPLVASRHYIETGNLRYFEVQYTSVTRLESSQTVLRPKFPADGRLAIVLCETREEQTRAIRLTKELQNDQSTWVGITAPLETLTGLILELERWTWVEQHTPELKDDRFAAEEVSRQLSVPKDALEKAVARHVGLRGVGEETNYSIRWFYRGKEETSINSTRALQMRLSDTFDSEFSEAPRVNNELVNRHMISAAAAAARQRLFGYMLRNRRHAELLLPVEKAPPEKSIYLSVLRKTGIHTQVDGKWDIRIPMDGKKSSVRASLIRIVALLEQRPGSRVNVKTIVDELRAKPYGVRDGIIPLLLVTVLIEHETEVAVYEDGKFVPEIEEFLLMRLAKRPETFEFQITRISGVRRQLIEQFAEILAAKHSDRLELISVVRPLCASVAALPEYVHYTERLTPHTHALRSAIIRSQEPAQLVFKDIPTALGFEALEDSIDAAEVAKSLATSLLELRRAFPELQTRMSQAVLSSFASETESLRDWRSRIANRADKAVVALTEPDLRAFALKLCDDQSAEPEWLESLGSFLVRKPPSRWRDSDEAMFVQRLSELTQKYLRVEGTHFRSGDTDNREAIRVTLIRDTGEEADKVLLMSKRHIQEASEAKSALRAVLPEDKQVALAALSQLMWSLLKEIS